MTSAGLGAAAYLIGMGLAATAGVLILAVAFSRGTIYVYYERYLAFKTFEEFRRGKIRHRCIACGASCHLKVNLGKDDVERVLKYAKEKGLTEPVIETRGNQFWLRRRPTGACIFLKYEGNIPRCSIYPIRPTACRLYPLVPSGNRLKADRLCPGFSKTEGMTFKEHLLAHEVGAYVRKVMGKI